MSEPHKPGMSSPTPYLLRALFDWICDNGMSPYLRVVVDSERVRVPDEYVEDGVIVLNISPAAVRGLEITAECVRFSARFNQNPFDISVPVENVQAIYSRETGQGLVLFEDGAAAERSRAPAGGEEADEGGRPDGQTSGRPNLRLVE